MPEDIEKTIYRLELDGSAYIQGVESLSASTKKLTDEQDRANKALQVSQSILKQQSAYFQQTKKDLDSYTGTNEKYRAQLTKTFSSAEADNKRLTDVVLENQKAYEKATKAAQDFAATSAKASQVQQQTTGGKIPTGPPPAVSQQITQQIAGVLNVADFAKQAQIIEQTKHEFDDLRVSIALADERMKQLNETDEEFKQLAPIVAKGKEALQQYDNATKSTEASSGSLRTRLREGREELVKLEQAGKGATKQYFELEKSVAKLTDEFGDQQARIKILASDTKLLDFGKGAITAATSAFQVYTSVSILVGEENEELQKKTMQLFAAMQLLQSLEQLSNLTRREGILTTLAGSAAQGVYTAVVGTSTGALKAFRLALAATGIGAAVVIIGLLVGKWIELREAQAKAAAQQKAMLDISNKAADSYAEEVTHLKLLATEYQNVNTSATRKKEIQDELQKSYPNYFSDLDKHADKEKYIAEQVGKVTEALITQAKIQGAQSFLAEKFKEVLKLKFDPDQTITALDRVGASFRNLFDDAARADLGKVAAVHVNNAEFEFGKLTDFVGGYIIDLNGKLSELGGDPKAGAGKDKKAKIKKQIDDDYEARRAALVEQIAKLAETEYQSELSIRKSNDAKLKKALIDLDKDKGLKPKEREDLINLTLKVNTTELNKALEDFRKKQVDARQKLGDELEALQDKNTLDQLNLLQDEFDRRAKLIEFNQAKEIVDAITTTQRRLDALDMERSLIGEAAYQDARAKIISTGEDNVLIIEEQAAIKRKALAADLFQELLNSYTSAIGNSDLIFTENEAKAIRSLADKYLAGKISREKFEKEITKIQKDAASDRLHGQLAVERDELAELDRQLASIEDKYSDHYKKLKKQRDDLAGKVASDTIAAAKDETDDPNKKKVETVQQYVEAVGAVADSVIQFWQAANAAESAALDRSISLQEKRVSAAQKIADRGNAQYLKAEEDRLTELNLKRENAARKQLGIDAALQASQILVGITGAISKIATPGIGIAETIGSIAIIVGALATGYGLVKSLQGNQPKLFKGTTDLKRDKHPAGRDTIPAWLNEGEAVIPTDKNKKYKKAVEAIYHGKVPADVMNEFVENYVTKTVKNEKKNITNISTFENFEQKVSQIPVEVLHNFISNYKVKKFFTGTTEVGKESIPAWINKTSKDQKVNNSIKAIQDKKVPAEVMSRFVENYIKERQEKIKKESEFKDIINKAESLITQKTLSKEENLILNDVSKVNKRILLEKLTREKIEKNQITSELQNSLVNKNITIDQVHKYSEVIDKVIEKKLSLDTHKKFIENIEKVPAKVLTQFINSYEEKKFFRGTPELTGKPGIDQIPIWATKGEAIIPQAINNLYKPVIKTLFDKSIPHEHLNKFVNNYHQIKQVPQVNYERIKEAAELKINSDGRMSVAINEQNKLIVENNDLQRQTLRAMKSMSVSANIDKDGVAIMVNEYIQQMKIDAKI